MNKLYSLLLLCSFLFLSCEPHKDVNVNNQPNNQVSTLTLPEFKKNIDDLYNKMLVYSNDPDALKKTEDLVADVGGTIIRFSQDSPKDVQTGLSYVVDRFRPIPFNAYVSRDIFLMLNNKQGLGIAEGIIGKFDPYFFANLTPELVQKQKHAIYSKISESLKEKHNTAIAPEKIEQMFKTMS